MSEWYSPARRWRSWWNVRPTVAEAVADTSDRIEVVMRNPWIDEQQRALLAGAELLIAAVLLEVARPTRVVARIDLGRRSDYRKAA